MTKLDIRQKILFYCLLLFIFFSHIFYIPNGFTWLDHRDIENQHAILPLFSLTRALSTRYGDTGFYRPLVTLANSIDAVLYQEYAPGYHLTNVLLFTAIIAVIPFFLSAYIRLSFYQSLFAAFFVGVHPYGFLPVGSISYRPELLLTLFLLLAIYFHYRARQAEKPITNAVVAWVCFALALLSKETSLVLFPGAVILWELKKFHQQPKTALLRYIKQRSLLNIFFVYLGLIVVYLSLRMHAVPEIWRTSVSFPSFDTAVGTRLSIVGKLLLAFFSPFLLSISDVTPIVSITHPFSLLTIAFFLISAWIIYKWRRSSSFVTMLALWLLFLTPALNIVPVPRMSSPHYGFVATIPLSACIIFIAGLIHRQSLQPFTNSSLKIITIFWLIIATTQTIQVGSRFYNDEKLFRPEVVRSPYFYEGYFYLGNFYLQKQNLPLAQVNYQRAISRHDTIIAYREPLAILTNLAAVYYAQKKYADADITLREALRYANTQQQTTLIYNRALIAKDQKNYQQVIALLSQHYQHNPLAMLLLADCLHALHRDSEAKTILLQSLPFWPETKRAQIQEMIKSLSEN